MCFFLTKASLCVLWLAFHVFLLGYCELVVSTSAVDYLETLIYGITCYVSSGTF